MITSVFGPLAPTPYELRSPWAMRWTRPRSWDLVMLLSGFAASWWRIVSSRAIEYGESRAASNQIVILHLIISLDAIPNKKVNKSKFGKSTFGCFALR